MSYAQQALLEHIFGITPFAEDWYIGIYDSGVNPVVDLLTAEIMRIPLGAISWNTSYIQNDETLVFGPLPLVSVGGVFVCNGENNLDLTWYKDFTVPVTIEANGYLRLEIGDVHITVI